MLGEPVGETAGYRVRLERKVGPKTRIESVTTGLFLRQLQGDPELRGVAAVLFDEFHERSLDADLALALSLEAQGGLRPDLRLVVMSATLDTARVAALLPQARTVVAKAASFRSRPGISAMRRPERGSRIASPRRCCAPLRKKRATFWCFFRVSPRSGV